MSTIGIWSALSLLGIAYLLFWRYRMLRVDAFRQEMFELRDRLFDYAADGNITFGHPGYCLLRTTMNGFIRLGERLSFWQLVFYRIVQRGRSSLADEYEARWVEAIAELPPPVREQLESFRWAMHLIVVKHLAMGSLTCGAVAAVSAGLFYARRSAKARGASPRSEIAVQMRPIDSAALSYGR